MKSSAKKVELASVDDLFSTEESRADAQRERVLEIPLSELHPFKNHPFKVKDDESMMETADSVRQYGVLVPAIARPDPEGGYELVAGHRRHRASELAEKETMPVIVRELDDDAATIIMVDSNLQRESLLPSERAFAYKMKLDAMKRQAGRPSKNSAQLGRNFDGKESREILAEQVGQSRNQISRYIRLTELIPELLDMVDAEIYDWKSFDYNTPEVGTLFLQIRDKLIAGETSRLYYESKVGELLSIVAGNFHKQRQQIASKQQNLSKSEEKVLESVRQAIEQNVLNPPEVSQLCKIAAMGQTKLRESFKSIYGVPIGTYIRQVKMRYALLLLVKPDLTIGNIAEHLGYANASKFAAAFRKVYGQSPEEYRNQKR